MHFKNGFGHPDKKFRFKPKWDEMGPDFEGMPSLPGYYTNIDLANDKHPFRMVAAPARNYLNSSFTETPTSKKREGRPTVKLHPDDLVALGAKDGDVVQVGNDLGEIEVHAVAFEGLQRGVCVVESIWPTRRILRAGRQRPDQCRSGPTEGRRRLSRHGRVGESGLIRHHFKTVTPSPQIANKHRFQNVVQQSQIHLFVLRRCLVGVVYSEYDRSP